MTPHPRALLPAPVLPSADDVAACDVRLVVVDMDGTLLDAEHRMPEAIGALLGALAERGIALCPASGRQVANVVERFGDAAAELVVVGENGAHVVQGATVLATDPLDRAVVRGVVEVVRGLARAGGDVGVVLCGRRSAYVERTDGPFRTEADRYYTLLQEVDDVLAVDDDVLKVAVFDFGSAAETTAPALERFRDTHQVVVSGLHWVDVMNAGTHKGAAVRRVQEHLGVTRDQTMAFGDYLNDVEMLEAAAWSFAMANAHPDVLARARFVAPANDADGVLRTLSAVLRLHLPGLDLPGLDLPGLELPGPAPFTD